MAAPQISGQVAIDTAASGDVTLVEAPTAPGAFIRVVHYRVSSAGNTVVKFKSDDLVIDAVQATTVAGSGIVTPFEQDGVLDCQPGAALVLNNGSAVAIGGCVRYVVKGAQ